MKEDQMLRILFVEDLPSDAELAERELRKGGISFTAMRVETKKEFLQALKDFRPDLIISDYALPEFDGMQALKLSLKYDADIPFVLFTGSMNEETAVACMKAGATDYIIKERIRRLPMAVAGALKQKRAQLAEKEAVWALQKSEKHYRELFESIMDVFYRTDNEGTILIVSPSIEKVLGYTPDEVIGKATDALYIHPEERHRFISAVREKGVIKGFEATLRAKDGSAVCVSTHAHLYRDDQGNILGVQGITRDITERKRAETEIRASEERFRAIFERSTIGKSLMMPDGRLLQANKAFADMIGYTTEKIQRLTFEQITHPDDVAESRECIRSLLTGEQPACRLEKRYLHKNGSIVWADVSTMLLRDEKKTPLYLITSIVNITERKKAEEQLQQTLESLRDAVSTTIQVIGSTVETRDPYTANHQIRCADLARTIATEMKLPRDRIEGIRMAGLIHDLGKLAVPAEILSKPTLLTEIEFSLIKEHPRKGYEILKHVKSPWPLAEIVYQHHERMDGSGYPRNLKGDEILMEARILAVCDVVESMASHRPYRAALGVDAALKEIEDNRGGLYDADVVDACLRLFREKGFQFNPEERG